MQITSALQKLGRNDIRLIGRDSFLTGMFAYIIVMAVIVRFALPWLAETIAANPDMDINVPDFYPLVVGFVAIYLGGVMGGMMIGFIVLDERDDNTIKALLVTPLPVNYYLAYRVLIPMLLAFITIMADVLIINQAMIPLWQLVIIAAGASLTGPVVALFLATFAENKVQGFALNKIIGTLGLAILAAWFVAPPAQFLFGIVPQYWIVKAYWTAVEGGSEWPIYLGIGVVMMVGVIGFFVRRFHRIAYA